MAAAPSGRFLLLVAAAALLAAGCAPSSWYPEYLYPGTAELVNLVADKTFATDWDLDPELRALGATAGIYLTFEDASADATTAGISPPAPGGPLQFSPEIWRLEIHSLIPQGDFTATDVGAVTLGQTRAGWRHSPSAGLGVTGVHEIVDGSHPSAIRGNTMHFVTTTNDSRLDYDLRDPVWGAADGFLEAASYFVRFSYRTSARPVVLEFRDSLNPVDNDTWLFYGDGSVLEFPPESVVDRYAAIGPRGEADYFLSFGSVETHSSDLQDAYIDDLRLVRTGIPCNVELLLPYTLTLPIVGGAAGTTYSLESGRYTLKFWVRDDPTVGTAPNRLAADALTITLRGGDLGDASGTTAGTKTFVTVVTRGAGGWPGAGADGWAQVELTATESVQLAPTTNPAAAVMVLAISPTDWHGDGGRNFDAGSILIAGPVLQFASASTLP